LVAGDINPTNSLIEPYLYVEILMTLSQNSLEVWRCGGPHRHGTARFRGGHDRDRVRALLDVRLYANALRGNVTQVDVLDAGRAAYEMISRELEELSACRMIGRPNLLAVRTDATPVVQTDLDNSTPLRTNLLQELFFLTQITNQWTGIGYRVAALDGVGTLYRFAATAKTAQLLTNDLYARFRAAQVDPRTGAVSANLHRVTDGIIHLRVVPYDESGRRLDVAEPLGFTNFLQRVLRPGENPPTNSSPRFSPPDVAPPRKPNQTEFFSRAMPFLPIVNFELGVLERATKQYQSVRELIWPGDFWRSGRTSAPLSRTNPIHAAVQ
jgi:hypothetical protein